MEQEKCPDVNFDSKGCPVIAPVTCDTQTEKQCLGGYDVNGCELQSVCIPQDGSCKSSLYKQDGCPAIEPLQCKADEIQCWKGTNEKVII